MPMHFKYLPGGSICIGFNVLAAILRVKHTMNMFNRTNKDEQ